MGPVESLILRAWGRGVRIDSVDTPDTHATELVQLIHEARNIDKVHPWLSFLRARMRCLAWLRDEMRETPEQSVITMQMDPQQVALLLTTYDEHVKAKPEPAPECTCVDTRVKPWAGGTLLVGGYDPNCPRHGREKM